MALLFILNLTHKCSVQDLSSILKGVGTNVAEGAIAPPLFYRKKGNTLTCFADSKANGIKRDWQCYYTMAGG